MNKYDELAELIFPEITKTISDLEKEFPKRDLPLGAMVTRFAPSPTGFLHTGSLFTALIGWKFASQTNGVFYTRLEDTDQKREIKGSAEELISQLQTFGVVPFEGYFSNDKEIGKYGPYVQSRRAEIYKTVIKEMIRKNQAYPCFCSTDDLKEMHEVQEKNKENFGYYGKYAKCSFLTASECIENIKAGKPYIIRFRSLGNYQNKILIHDAIRGDIEMSQNDQHIVIYKSDGLPTYHFAHLCDDHFMHTTHVTRGEEWLPSLPIHIELFDTVGFEKPVYAHLPVIMKLDNGNKRKLSKRKDPEASVQFFLESGYPIGGFLEYLYTIANSNFEEWHTEHSNEPKENFMFSFDKMSLDGALFDLEKIKSLSKEYLGNMSVEKFYQESLAWAKDFNQDFYDLINRDNNYYKQIISIEREQEKPRKDYEKFSDVMPLINFFYDDYYEENYKNMVFPEKLNKEDIIQVLKDYKDIFNLNLCEEEWFSQMKEVAVKNGFAATPKEYKKNPEGFKGHVGDVAAILRVSISLRMQSPNLYYIMKIIDYDRICDRINKVVKLLEE